MGRPAAPGQSRATPRGPVAVAGTAGTTGFDSPLGACHNGAMKLAWLTDTHPNFLRPAALEAFLDALAATEAGAFVVTGDIGEADDVVERLHTIADRVARPV